MTLYRVLLICLSLIGFAWISLSIVDIDERADDKAVYGRKVRSQAPRGMRF